MKLIISIIVVIMITVLLYNFPSIIFIIIIACIAMRIYKTNNTKAENNKDEKIKDIGKPIKLDINQKDRLISYLKNELEAKHSHDSLSDHCTNLDDQLKEKKQEIDSLNSQIVLLNKELSDKNKVLLLSSLQINKFKTEYHHNEIVNQLKEKIEKLNDDLSTYDFFDSKYNEMFQEMKLLRDKFKDAIIIGNNNTIIANIDQYRTLSVQQYNEIKSLRKNIKVLSSLLSVIVEEFTKFFDAKLAAFGDSDNKIKLEYLVNKYKTDITNNEIKINELSSKLETAEKKLNIIGTDNYNIRKEIDLLMIAGCNDFTETDPCVLNETNNWRYSVSEVSNKFRSYANRLRSFNVKIKKLEDTIKDLSANEVAKVENEIKSLNLESFGLNPEHYKDMLKIEGTNDRYKINRIDFYVAGLNYIEEYMPHATADNLKDGDELVLTPELDNVYDMNAVAVYATYLHSLYKIGYVEKGFAKEIKKSIEDNRLIKCTVKYTLGREDYLKVYGNAFMIEK